MTKITKLTLLSLATTFLTTGCTQTLILDKSQKQTNAIVINQEQTFKGVSNVNFVDGNRQYSAYGKWSHEDIRYCQSETQMETLDYIECLRYAGDRFDALIIDGRRIKLHKK